MAAKTFGKGQLFQVCVTAQNTDITAVQFAALTYIDVCCLDETPEMTRAFSLISENCISGEQIRGSGAPEDSDMTVSWYYDSACVGQDTLRGFGLAGNSTAYAVRKVLADAGTSPATTPTTIYGRMIFTGYTNNGVDLEGVQGESVTGSLVQGPLVVKPAPV